MQFNIKQATRRLKQRFPDRGVCVEVECWDFESGNKRMTFSASFVPGFNSMCSQYKFKSHDEFLEWLETFLTATNP